MAENGMNLRELRKEAGLTQAELARRVGCSPDHINKVERGKVNLADGMAEKIKAALQSNRGVLYKPPSVNFDTEKQEADLKAIWLKRRYGTE